MRRGSNENAYNKNFHISLQLKSFPELRESTALLSLLFLCLFYQARMSNMAKSISFYKTVAGLALCPWTSMASAAPAPMFTLSSPAFTDNGVLAKQFAGNIKANPACIGDNFSPAFSWQNAPKGTQSFTLTIRDVDANHGLGVNHLVTYGIPATATGFAQDALSEGKGFVGGRNTMGHGYYNGPCPPVGTGSHHYIVQLIATDLAPNALPKGLTYDQLFERLKGHAIDNATLVARFGE